MSQAIREILLQPTRFKIALYLANSSSAQYIDQVAIAVQESPRLVAHHLELLENMGLVSSEFRIIENKGSGRGFAGRFFTPLPKLRATLEELAEMASRKTKEVRHEG